MEGGNVSDKNSFGENRPTGSTFPNPPRVINHF
jgi:hypothetical protein